MPTIPGPSEKQPAEGARDVIERELRRDASAQAQQTTRAMNPGDEVPPGTPGAGETICSVCAGSGRRGQEPCPNCGGSGKVIQAIGGA